MCVLWINRKPPNFPDNREFIVLSKKAKCRQIFFCSTDFLQSVFFPVSYPVRHIRWFSTVQNVFRFKIAYTSYELSKSATICLHAHWGWTASCKYRFLFSTGLQWKSPVFGHVFSTHVFGRFIRTNGDEKRKRNNFKVRNRDGIMFCIIWDTRLDNTLVGSVHCPLIFTFYLDFFILYTTRIVSVNIIVTCPRVVGRGQ